MYGENATPGAPVGTPAENEGTGTMGYKSPKGIISIIVVLAIIAAGGYALYQKGSDFDLGGAQGGESGPVQAVVAPELELTAEEKRGDIAEKKAQILARVSSSRSLTAEEKAEIGGIMLTKAHIYNFSEAEREKIFAALQR